MRSLFLVLIIFLAGCHHTPSYKKEVKVAAVHVDQASHDAAANSDSLIREEQNRHGEWMVRTFYNLKQLGFSYKKTWVYIDSATQSIYRDSIPHWYEMLKQQTDSSIRDKKLYKRIPIM